MTYNNIYTQPQYQAYQPVTGPANTVFHPGFAGTNVQEVRALNAGQPAPSVSSTYPMAGYGVPVNSVYSPGFAGTNVQEVRALNSGYPAPSINPQAYQVGLNPSLTNVGITPQYSSVGVTPTYTSQVTGPASINAIFQPGFAGTNAQEVRTLNSGGYASTGMTGGLNNIFSPNFAGTNVQEVRALNSGYTTPAISHQPYSQMGVPTGLTNVGLSPAYTQVSVPTTANAIFQPGFAGTNPQEVRSDYWQTQQHVPYGVGYAANTPYRTY